MFGDSKEVKALEALALEYDRDPSKAGMAAQIRAEIASIKDAAIQGYLKTARGEHQPQAKPKSSGVPSYLPGGLAPLTTQFTNNPMSLGGAAFAPVDREMLNPWEEDISKRSPWWGLLGYK